MNKFFMPSRNITVLTRRIVSDLDRSWIVRSRTPSGGRTTRAFVECAHVDRGHRRRRRRHRTAIGFESRPSVSTV